MFKTFVSLLSGHASYLQGFFLGNWSVYSSSK